MADYGSATDVASYVPMHASGGTFSTSTSPTLATVNAWLVQLSAAINLELDNYGYSTPATGNLRIFLDGFANEEVAAQIRAVYSRTRRGPTDDQQQDEGPRSLLANMDRVRDMLNSLSRGDRTSAGSSAVTRADGYSSTYSTVDVDT